MREAIDQLVRAALTVATMCLLACAAGNAEPPSASSEPRDAAISRDVHRLDIRPAPSADADPPASDTFSPAPDARPTADVGGGDAADTGSPPDAIPSPDGSVAVAPGGSTARVGDCPLPAGTTGMALNGPSGPWSVGGLGRVAPTSTASSTGDGLRLVGGLKGGRNFDGKHENRPDEAFFVHKRVEGDATLTAKVTSLGGLSGFGAIGLMIRADLNPCGLHGAALTNGTGASFNCRRNAFPGSSCTAKNAQPLGVPGWLRVVRAGDQVTAFVSRDGTNWTQLGTQTIKLPRTVVLGFLVTHGGTADVAFSNIAVTSP